MEDKAYTFVCKIFNDYNYNGSQWEIDTQIDSYYNMLKSKEEETGKEYDYDKMYSLIEREYKYKTVPAKTDLLKWQKRCVKNNYDSSQDGKLLLFLCYKKYTYLCYLPEFATFYHLAECREYIVSNTESTQSTDKQIIKKLKQIYDDVEVKIYKKGSALIGDVVFIPNEYYAEGYVIEYLKEKVA